MSDLRNLFAPKENKNKPEIKKTNFKIEEWIKKNKLKKDKNQKELENK